MWETIHSLIKLNVTSGANMTSIAVIPSDIPSGMRGKSKEDCFLAVELELFSLFAMRTNPYATTKKVEPCKVILLVSSLKDTRAITMCWKTNYTHVTESTHE